MSVCTQRSSCLENVGRVSLLMYICMYVYMFICIVSVCACVCVCTCDVSMRCACVWPRACVEGNRAMIFGDGCVIDCSLLVTHGDVSMRVCALVCGCVCVCTYDVSMRVRVYECVRV